MLRNSKDMFASRKENIHCNCRRPFFFGVGVAIETLMQTLGRQSTLFATNERKLNLSDHIPSASKSNFIVCGSASATSEAVASASLAPSVSSPAA